LSPEREDPHTVAPAISGRVGGTLLILRVFGFSLQGMGPANGITFDDSLWPLLVVRFSGTPTNQQFEEYLAKRGAYLARRQKHALIYDTASFRVLTNEQRQRQIDWLKERAALMKETSLGSALVITSPIVRLTLSIVLQFSQAGTAYHTARSLPEAAGWAAARLVDAGLHLEAQRVRTHFDLVSRRSTG
jgi:nitrogen-specific signal transduction histidine kinase